MRSGTHSPLHIFKNGNHRKNKKQNKTTHPKALFVFSNKLEQNIKTFNHKITNFSLGSKNKVQKTNIVLGNK